MFVRSRLTLLVDGMALAFGFAIASLGPAMPSLRDDLGISRTIGGLHFTALAVGAVVTGFVVERAIGRWGRRRVCWSGAAGIALGSSVIGLGWHPAVTIVGAFVVGSFGAATVAVNSATLSDLHPAHTEVAITEMNTASSAGSVLPAALIGALVAIGVGWRPAFVVPLVLLLVLAYSGRREEFPNSPHSGGADGARLPGAYWFFWAAFAPAVAAEWAVAAWGAGYLVDVAGRTEDSASFLMTVFFGAMLVGRFVGGFVARRVSAFPLVLGTSGIGLAGVLLFRGSRDVSPVVAGLLVAGLGISMLFPMLMSLAIGCAPDRPDKATARVFVSGGGAVLIAPLTLGVIADRTDIRTAFTVVPWLFVVLVVLVTLGWGAARSSHGEPIETPRS